MYTYCAIKRSSQRFDLTIINGEFRVTLSGVHRIAKASDYVPEAFCCKIC